MSAQTPVFLIDGSAYIYRAYHAIAPLTNRHGLPTHAVYGFTNILLRVIREKAPEYLAVAFDLKGPTFRHGMYKDYKANRPPMPADLIPQIPYIKQVVEAHNILCLEEQGVEADDLIAAAARILARNDIPVVVVSGDKDLLQLVSDRISVWDPMSDRLMDPAAVRAKYQVGPESLLDLFALIGDTADNIPGVPGVGPKTAEKLINQFGDLEGVYSHLAEAGSAKMLEKLASNRELAFLSRDLIRLKEDVVVPAGLAAYRLPAPDEERLRVLYTELEFSRLLKEEVAPQVGMDTAGFNLVDSTVLLDKLVALLQTAPVLALDTETDSLDTKSAGLVGLSLAVAADQAFYIPVGHTTDDGAPQPGQLPAAQVLAALRPLLENKELPKVCHNLKFDYAVLRGQGVTLAGPLWDTMIASYLLDPSRRSQKLDDLAGELLAKRLTSYKEVTGGDKRSDSFAHVPVAAACPYSCEDALATFLLWHKFRPLLEQDELWSLFADMEMALVPVLVEMEQAGIRVDPAMLGRLSAEFGDQLRQLEQDIFALAGGEFNINSPRQLGEILFEKLKLPQGRKTKTGYSTDVQVLEKLAGYHDLPAAVIRHRNLAKLKSTYADKLADLVDPATGRVHTSFNQTITATGRLSSSNPNLQNIPIRTPEGQQIRQTFVPDKGCIFLSADYSQIDLRVLAHYSQDPALLTAFRSGQDVHSRTAAEIFRVNPGFITPEMRRVAKTINFGIVYGMSAFGLAGQLHLSRKEAATFIARYFELYAGVKRYMTDIVRQAREQGYVTTLFHRRRPLPELASSNKALREFAERTAINTPIQGTAADIIKLAMLEVDRCLKKAGLATRMLLQIHDELVFEVPAGEEATVAVLVRLAMETVAALDVPLVVNLATGRNLAEV